MEKEKKKLLNQYIDFFETIPTDYRFDQLMAKELTEFWRLFYRAAAYCYDLEQVPESLTELINQVTPYHITIVRRSLVNTYYHFTYSADISKEMKKFYQKIYWDYVRFMGPIGRGEGIDLRHSEMLIVKVPNNLVPSKEVGELIKDHYYLSDGISTLDEYNYLYTNTDMAYCVSELNAADGAVPARMYLEVLRAEL